MFSHKATVLLHPALFSGESGTDRCFPRCQQYRLKPMCFHISTMCYGAHPDSWLQWMLSCSLCYWKSQNLLSHFKGKFIFRAFIQWYWASQNHNFYKESLPWAQPGALWQPRGMGWLWEVGGRFKREGDMCVPVADSCWCMLETSTTLRSNYPPIKN